MALNNQIVSYDKKGLERNSIFVSLIRIFSVPLLNVLPAKLIQKVMKKTGLIFPGLYCYLPMSPLNSKTSNSRICEIRLSFNKIWVFRWIICTHLIKKGKPTILVSEPFQFAVFRMSQ